MRLRRLDLTRYGRFTDHSIDFGAAVAGEPDLHLVYGPNEAGKSTALAGFLDLLFGIETRSRFNFRHPYSTMRIGAELETQAGPRGFIRIKRPQGSLLDGEERPIADGALLGELMGLDRAAYQAMFCLDDDTLEAGGRSILESRGELGQLLFAASSGLARLSQTLARLREAADGFHRPGARNVELARMKAALDELKRDRDRLDTIASEYHRLAERRDSDRGQYETALAQRTRLLARIEAIGRQLAALPHRAEAQRLQARLAGLADLPCPPAGWAEEVPKLQRDEVQLATRAGTLEQDIADRAARLAAITVDEVAAGLAARMDSLAELRARHVTAELDIPLRQREAQAAAAAVARVLERLGRAGEGDPGALVLPARLSATLNGLITARSGVAAALALAEREHAGALQRLGDARQALAAAGGAGLADSEAAMLRVAAAAATLRGSDHAIRQRAAERAREAAAIRLADQMAALRPWVGDAAELARMEVPEAGTIARWQAALDQAGREGAQLGAQLAQLDTGMAQLRAELDAMTAVLGVVSDREAAEIRTARETAWAEHRRRLDADSAERFEAVLRRDDLVMAARLGHQATLAKAQELARAGAVQAAERDRVAEMRQASAARHEAVAAEMAACVAAGMPGVPATIGPDDLAAWLARRGRALETWTALREAEAEIGAAGRDAVAAEAGLRAALAQAGLPQAADAQGLLAAAEVAMARDSALAAAKSRVAAAEAEVAARAHALQAAGADDRAWRGRWAAACGACWLGADGAAPDTEEVAAQLAALGELVPLLQRAAELAGRIAAMAEDQARFAAEIGEIAGRLGIDPAGQRPLDLAQQVADRVAAARAARTQREEGAAALAELQAQRNRLAQDEGLLAARREAMLAFFGVDALDAVRTKLLAVAERDELRRRAAAAEAAMAEALGVADAAAAEAVLGDGSKEALQDELVGLRTEADLLETGTRELFARSRESAAAIAAIGGDDAVARIEGRRRTALLEIEAAAADYLRLRAGILAAEMALRAYRDRHRSSMMARAAAAFRGISRDAYRGLTSRPEKDGEVLIAVAADGTSKLVDDLSKGTRFQLYLALRAAGYQEFAAMHRPVPFVADDIMETFDDFRAEETFRVFADMARVGQVIYLTHHRHLCEIATRLVPGVRVHALGG